MLHLTISVSEQTTDDELKSSTNQELTANDVSNNDVINDVITDDDDEFEEEDEDEDEIEGIVT